MGLTALIVAIGAAGWYLSRTRPASAAETRFTVVEAPVSEQGRVPDPTLEQDREEYLQDLMAFTGQSHEESLAKLMKGTQLIADEWRSWEAQGPMTTERTEAFYKQTPNYFYDLGWWHLYSDEKRQWDLKLVELVREKYKPRTVLDFGCGTGNNSVMLARAGYEVTLADLDSKTLDFALSRMKRHDLPFKVWRTDTEPMPPLPSYDLILALDVLEHLPKPVLRDTVDKLLKLKGPNTKLLVEAPFGRNSTHPMHEDADPEILAIIKKLNPD